MGFFKDFKDDLSQAVDELTAEETAAAEISPDELAQVLMESAADSGGADTLSTVDDGAETGQVDLEQLSFTDMDLADGNTEDTDSFNDVSFGVPEDAPEVEEVSFEPEPIMEPEAETIVESEPMDMQESELQPNLEPIVEPESIIGSDTLIEVESEPEAIPMELESQSEPETIPTEMEPQSEPEPIIEPEPIAEQEPEPVEEEEPAPIAFQPESEEETDSILTETMADTALGDNADAITADISIFEESEKMSEEKEFNIDDGPATDESSVITQGMTIKGDVTSEGSLEVIGAIQGDIAIKGKLTISGVITGTSRAGEIFADSAKITGDINSTGSVKIGQASVILGNVTGTSAVIAGAVKGDIDVHGPVILDTSAIVMGDIKSKSVQINNGAVIEGHCSQCYADVSPTSFFQELKG